MTTAAPALIVATDRAAATRAQVTLTIIYAVSTIGMIVTIVASFVALMIESGRGSHALFALVAGSLAFASLALVQFVQWSAILLRKLRRAK